MLLVKHLFVPVFQQQKYTNHFFLPGPLRVGNQQLNGFLRCRNTHSSLMSVPSIGLQCEKHQKVCWVVIQCRLHGHSPPSLPPSISVSMVDITSLCSQGAYSWQKARVQQAVVHVRKKSTYFVIRWMWVNLNPSTSSVTIHQWVTLLGGHL